MSDVSRWGVTAGGISIHSLDAGFHWSVICGLDIHSRLRLSFVAVFYRVGLGGLPYRVNYGVSLALKPTG